MGRFLLRRTHRLNIASNSSRSDLQTARGAAATPTWHDSNKLPRQQRTDGRGQAAGTE